MEKEKNVVGVAAISFVLGMLIAFISVVVAVVVTRPCVHGGFDKPYMEMRMPGHSFDKHQAHEQAKRFEQRAIRGMKRGHMPRPDMPQPEAPVVPAVTE